MSTLPPQTGTSAPPADIGRAGSGQTPASRRQHRLDDTERRRFDEEGFAVARGLFSAEEVAELRDEFMAMHAAGPIPGHFEPVPDAEDVLRAYPRIMHPHQVNGVALRYLLDPRIRDVLTDLFGEEPLAAQSMFYFKPPGARGQALHQDNFYLRVEPGTCIAAWLACDVIDRANGGLEVVPGTHRMDLFCPEEADPSVSFTREYVPPPPGLRPVPGRHAAGRCLVLQRQPRARVGPEHDDGPVPPVVHLSLRRPLRRANRALLPDVDDGR
ncbi:phytanoyl-CoA dioxygenase PhyH [Thermasporomyces composti]|uniref:Phytanoyl-CoA dioxygenase PhyH n=1 Tax=Thermasporomyces composti TaxID=696763 RepID=A0A3D9V1Q9_THECX|nr:phytanoyl-CoA dioxygenase PhyH [Thermasporomyces composti]